MSNIKLLNDFEEILADLDTAMKKEKNADYKNFIRIVKDNIALWKIKYSTFLENVSKK